MNTAGVVPAGRQGAGHEVGHADQSIGVAQRPLQQRTHPLAVRHVDVDDRAGLRQAAHQHADEGVAWPVGGLDDVDAVPAHVPGQPDEASHRLDRAEQPKDEADQAPLAAFGAEVDGQDGEVGEGAQRLGRRCWLARSAGIAGRVDLEPAAVEVGEDLGVHPHVRPERRLGGAVDEEHPEPTARGRSSAAPGAGDGVLRSASDQGTNRACARA